MISRMIAHTRYSLACLALCVPASAGTIYVDDSATGGNDGTSWRNAYVSLCAAIESASAQDEVWVAEGTYDSVVLKTGVRLFGGFAGSESSVLASDPAAHKTYISGRGVSRAVESVGNDSSTLVQGFYITEGFVDIPDTGAGAYLEQSDTMFVRCVFTANRAVTLGGAVTIRGGSPVFVNCSFRGNDGGWSSGAVFSYVSATPTFVNCSFYKNSAMEAGGVGIRTGAGTFVNCTLADNEATKGKGGALFDASSESQLHNCILWNNKSPVAGASEIWNLRAAHTTTTAVQSNIKGGWGGEGNIDVDPLFVDSANGDYRLQAGSPCRDKGDSSALPADSADLSLDGNKTETLPKDLGMKARVEGSAVDMGAFEWHPE